MLSAFIPPHRLGGNPFYLEETINSLIDAGTLKKRGADWEVSGTMGETVFSSSISSVIASRLDRLGNTAKRIAQEASVIGRRFSPAVLKQISSNPERVDHSLAILKSSGMILDSDDTNEGLCQFKHMLVQDVAYKSLLKRNRRNLHEKIARVLESQNPDRIDAFCEILAHHFSNGHSLHKALTYLKRSGRKGLKKGPSSNPTTTTKMPIECSWTVIDWPAMRPVASLNCCWNGFLSLTCVGVTRMR